MQQPAHSSFSSSEVRDDILSVASSHPHTLAAAVAVSLTLAGGVVGCAGSSVSTRAPSITQSDVIEPVSAELPPPRPRRTPERVVFADEVTSDEAGSSEGTEGSDAGDFATGFGDGASTPSGLVEQLAASYDDDMKALAAMQAGRSAGAATVNGAPSKEEPEFADRGAAAAAKPAPSTPAKDSAAPTAAEATPKSAAKATSNDKTNDTTSDTTNDTAKVTAGAAPTATPVTPNATEPSKRDAVAETPPGTSAGTSGGTSGETSGDASVHSAPQASTQPTAGANVLQANASLELPPAAPPIPTEPADLAKLLGESLVRKSGDSAHPMREWLSFAALAITDPDLGLPKDFGADLLPAERERIEKAHAAFAAIGRTLAQTSGGSDALDATAVESLVAALTGGPRLAIPKVEFCTKVESFGQFAPLGNNRFLARSNARFILYTELAGFTSALEDGEFVTRLATRVSIESERDGIEVWARTPAWTAVVDRSPTRRDDFFVGEIVPVSEYLSVGGYRLKIEVRDESSGKSATAYHPLQVVADPSMAAVGD